MKPLTLHKRPRCATSADLGWTKAFAVCVGANGRIAQMDATREASSAWSHRT